MAPVPLRDGDPSRIGRYRLTARLGAGGMGVVYLGTAKDGLQVAIKVLRSELADDPDFRVRFRREIAVLSRVQGICTVRLIEADTESVRPFLATEYADGPSLAEYVRSFGPLGSELLYGLATGLAEALVAIHAAGVVHRDLKPANVLLTPSGPKVIDFGIAQAVDSTALTRTGVVVGSPGFMAPEQIMGQAGHAADIFSWALTVAFAASGQVPFGIGSPDAILYRILHDKPDIGSVPASLLPLVQKALEKDPTARPSASELLAQLAAVPAQSEDIATYQTQTVLERLWLLPVRERSDAAPRRPLRMRTLIFSLAVVVASAIGAGVALFKVGPPTSSSTVASRTSGAVQVVTITPPVSASTSEAPSTTSPGAITTASEADHYVAGLGYSSPGVHNPAWEAAAPLNAVVAYYTGGATGPGKVFFFAEGRFVGTDTQDGSSSVGAIRVSATEVQVQYDLYNAGDPQCCPTGGTDDVRFSWTGAALIALDPIPVPAVRT